MANKKISELAVRTPSLSDLMLVGDPSTGYSYKATISSLSTLLEANIALDDLNDVTITSPTAGQVLSYNGTAWVNGTNGITGTGTTNYVPKFTSSSAIGNSQIFDNGTNVGIGTATPDSTARIEISKTDGYGLYINYTTNTGVAPTATGLYVINNTNLYGYSAVIEEKTPNTNTGQIPLLIKSSLSSGTVATGFATGIHFETPDDAGTFKRAQLSVDITNAVASTFSTRFRFNVRHNDISTNVFYIAGNGIGIFRNTPTAALDVNGDVKISNIPNATTDTDKFIVSDGGVIKYRTGSEVLSDIGGAAASSISGTTNYIPKFTSSSAIGNSVIYESGGSIGIGTTSPQATLEVYDAGTGNMINLKKVSSVTQASVDFYRANASTTTVTNGDNLGRISAWGYDGSAYSSIGAAIDFTVTGTVASNSIPGSIIFRTNAVGSQYASEKMRLDASGNLGLGTSSPTQILSIQANNPYIQFVNNSTTAGGLYWTGIADAYIAQVGSTNAIIPGTVAGSLAYRTANKSQLWSVNGGSSAAMTLDASGNLGLGVTPSAWGSSYKVMQYPAGFVGADGTLVIQMGQNHRWTGSANVYVNNGYASDYYQYNGSHIWQNAPSGTAGNAISFTQAMTLDASGRLLVGGTSASGAKLQVFPSTQYTAISSTDGLSIYNPSSTSANIILGINGGSANIIQSRDGLSTAYPLAINPFGGNVGIGTTSPTTYTGYTTLAINNATNGGLIDFMRNGVVDVQLVNNPTTASFEISSFTVGRSINFLTNGGFERMRITSGGNVGIGTTSPTRTLEVLSSGAIPARVSTTNSNMAIEYISTAGTRYNWLAGAQYNVSGAFEITPSTAVGGTTFSTPAFVVTSGGDVGIGTTTPGTKLEVNGAIKTASPSGGTAKPFKIGAAATVTPTSQNRTIEIEIDGTTYYLTAKTTND